MEEKKVKTVEEEVATKKAPTSKGKVAKLEEEVKQLQQEIEEYYHLATTVEAKDIENGALRKEIELKNKLIKEHEDKEVKIKKLTEEHDKLIEEYNTLIEFITQYIDLIQMNIQQQSASIQIFMNYEKTVRDRISKGEE